MWTRTTAPTTSSLRAVSVRFRSPSSAIASFVDTTRWRSSAPSTNIRPTADILRNRDQIRQERVRGLRQARSALHDCHLAEQVGVKDDAILLPLEACEQILLGQLLWTDSRGHGSILTRGGGHQLHATPGCACRGRSDACRSADALALDRVRREVRTE